MSEPRNQLTAMDLNKGDRVRWAAPENEAERKQVLTLLDDPAGLDPGDSVRVRLEDSGMFIAPISTVHLRDVVRA
jgi:hypothetical protein